MSPPETRLWMRVRGRAEGRPAVRRQYPVEPYILDFYCPEAKLAIEVDGAIHAQPDQVDHDVRRDAWLRSNGIEVLRLPAADLMRDPDAVADSVWQAILDRVARR